MSNTPDEFLQEILDFPAFPAHHNLSGNYAPSAPDNPFILHLISAGDTSSVHHLPGGGFHFPLGNAPAGTVVDAPLSSSGSPGHRTPNVVRTMPHPPVVRPTRMRARRGQATDPHSIAERIRREKIAERSRALQELVPSVNKTDRAVMVDEIVDYVKFLKLQVKVLSMSRLGGASYVEPLVTDTDVEDETGEGERDQPPWEKWRNDGTERHVVKLMEENVGAAMQFLQSKTLCIMPVSLASAIYHTQMTQPPDLTSIVNPESGSPL